MRPKILLNILGALSTILGLTMIVPILISLYYGEYDTYGFSISSAISILTGILLYHFTKYDKSLNNKDGFAIVTFSWILTAVIGGMPFYLSGAIPNITDAFFESMSGVTTTGRQLSAIQ